MVAMEAEVEACLLVVGTPESQGGEVGTDLANQRCV